jgi:hypothetical protein
MDFALLNAAGFAGRGGAGFRTVMSGVLVLLFAFELRIWARAADLSTFVSSGSPEKSINVPMLGPAESFLSRDPLGIRLDWLALLLTL